MESADIAWTGINCEWMPNAISILFRMIGKDWHTDGCIGMIG